MPVAEAELCISLGLKTRKLLNQGGAVCCSVIL